MGKGDAEFEMGRVFFYGKGSLARSYAEAVKHFRAACYDKPSETQGQPSYLPKTYNVPDCYSKAINYLIKAKEHGKIQDDDYYKFQNVAVATNVDYANKIMDVFANIDTNDQNALKEREKYHKLREEAVKQYNEKYPPFTKNAKEINKIPYPWSTTPFPWGDK